jgi:hypothetical protein
MKKTTALLLFFIIAGVSHCQTTLLGSYWHNGDYFTVINSETDTTVVTFTANLHEGADGIPWKKTANPDLYMRPNQIGNAWTDTIIYYHDSIVHKTIEGQEVLLIYGRERTLKDILLRYEGRSTNKWYELSHGFDSVLESNIRRQIMGSFYTSDQQAWHITSDSILIFSLSSIPNQPFYGYAYTIHWGETDSPDGFLTLSDGRNLCYKFTADGLDIYNGISHIEHEDFEWFSKGDLLCHLNKTNLDNAVPGRWPEASIFLLTRGYLEPYPTDVLRLMRNEIYARHGHSFKDKQLTEFYSKEGLWYGTALLLQNSTELSEIEKLNMQLIIAIEKERNKNQAKH